MAQLATNRYPARNAPQARLSKPKVRPKPANDNRPRPANDNVPPPSLPKGTARGLRIALGLAKVARGASPVSMVAGMVLDELARGVIETTLFPTSTLRPVPQGKWFVRFKCPTEFRGNRYSNTNVTSVANQCLLSQAMSTFGTFAEAVAAQPDDLSIGFWYRYEVGASFRNDHDTTFGRPNGPRAEAFPLPSLAPLALPVAVPWPEVVPLPRPDQWPVGLPMPAVNPAARGLARATANTPEGRATDRGPSRTRRPAQGPRTANPSKPPKGTKETKKTPRGGLANAVMQGMGKGLSSYSEMGDFVDSLHDALPENLQKGKNLGEKMRDLYAHINEVDWGKAVVNLAKNQVEDAIVGGLIGQVTGKKGLGSHLGNNAVAGPRVRY